MARVPLIQPVAPTGRVGRYPKHVFYIESQAYAIEPFMIAPVLPGETLDNLFFESRVVCDPIRNKLIGWKQEYYYFYVKVSDLLTDAIRDMFVDPTNTDLTATLGEAANVNEFYTAKGSIDYLQRCYNRIVTKWFRDEGEDHTDHARADGICYAQIRDTFWMDSLTDKDAMPEGDAIAGATDAGDLDRLLDAFEQLRALGLANMTYEDFLGTFGVRRASVSNKRPELLRHQKFWQLPATAVDGATGTTSSVVSWKVEGRADKNRAFDEHGFIVGLTTVEPKAYLYLQRSAGVTMLDSAFAWAPRMFDDDMAGITIRDYADGRGPLGSGVTEGYTLDTKDLFLYGDQFVNRDHFTTATLVNGHAMAGSVPTSKFTNTTAIDALFVAANTTNAFENDGRVQVGAPVTAKPLTH